MKIGLDLMGGDFAPLRPMEGVINIHGELPSDIQLVLFGNLSIIEEEYSLVYNEIKNWKNIEFIHTTQVIEMSDSPTKAFNHKTNSSMAMGLKSLADKEIDAFISAGNTGAMMVGAIYTTKTIEGIIRPTIATVLPKINGKYGLLLDVGGNSDCRQDLLFQFGLLGSVYMQHIYNIQNPRVALLSIGSEKEKGNLVTQAAYSLMEGNDKYNFVGNIEGYDLFLDKADVVVCDGFTGNILLKTIEGLFKIIKKRGIKDEYFDSFDYENYGGTPILGVNKPVIIGHGVSTARAFKNMITLAESVIRHNLIDEIKSLLENKNITIIND